MRTTRMRRTNADFYFSSADDADNTDFFFIFHMDALNIAQPLKSALSVSSADEKLLHTEGKSYSAFVRLIRVVRVPILAVKLSF